MSVFLIFEMILGLSLGVSPAMASIEKKTDDQINHLHQWAEHYSATVPQSQNHFTVTVGSALRARKHQVLGYFRSHVLKVPDQEFKAGYLPVTVSRSRKAQRAPLVIHLPGIFAGLNSPFGYRALQNLTVRGYHVAFVLNPWSRAYLDLGPKHEPGNLIKTADAVARAVDSVIAYLGADAISEVQLMGESYGAFLASVVAARWKASRSLHGPLLMLSPPFEMIQAIKNIDQTIHVMEKNIECSGYFKRLISATRAMWGASHVHCAQKLLSDDFLKGFKNVNRFGSQNFSKTLKDRFPHSHILFNGEQGKLSYWMNIACTQNRMECVAVASQDDFLNQGLSWDFNARSTEFQQWLKLSWGGHLGFVEMDEFQEFLDLMFAKK